jgi:hypothetical protein
MSTEHFSTFTWGQKLNINQIWIARGGGGRKGLNQRNEIVLRGVKLKEGELGETEEK